MKIISLHAVAIVTGTLSESGDLPQGERAMPRTHILPREIDDNEVTEKTTVVGDIDALIAEIESGTSYAGWYIRFEARKRMMKDEDEYGAA